MIFVSRRLGRGVARWILYVTAAYFFIFAPGPRRHMRTYLRRALGRTPTALDRYRLLLSFASCVHDRIFFMDDRFELFDVSVEGEQLVDEILRTGRGAVLMGGHMGSFEVVRSLARRAPGLGVAVLMYEANARKMTTLLAAVNPSQRPEIISVGHIDAMLRARARLDAGAFIGMLGDRSLANDAAVAVDFLGHPAQMPLAPMRAAALLRAPVVFMLGLYRGANRYHVVFEPLADFSDVARAQRDAAVGAAVARYAALLEKHCRLDPYNWFNFYDFWGRR
ncbi:MAG: acyl-CoA synthetase [Steroidobacterales bacterium]